MSDISKPQGGAERGPAHRRPIQRREMLRGSLAAGGLLGATACTPAASRFGAFAQGHYRPDLTPLRISADRIMEIKCCLRPFRAMGPRLDAEQIGDTLVVYNYGHGGSGWSLSWGSADIAVEKAMSVLPKEIAVIGCGVIGLTTAIMAQRAGAKVTIYTRDQLPHTRSVRAQGSWTPDSRIALTDPAGPAFGALWERMARTSYYNFRSFLGLADKPVDFGDNYTLSDHPAGPREAETLDPSITANYATTGMPHQSAEFASYMDRIRDITPSREIMPAGSTPFRQPFVARQSHMFFNFTTYGHRMMDMFHAAGGSIVERNFRSPGEFASLPQKVVIVCLGYAARDFLGDRSLIPVRGQTAWLVPQPDMNYGVYYKGFIALSKADGIVIQNVSSPLHEMAGVGDSNEVPIPQETLEGITRLQDVFPPEKTA